MNKFIPINKMVLLEEIVEDNKKKDEIEENLIFVSPEQKPNKQQQFLKKYKILDVAIDCNLNLRNSGKNKTTIVDVSMVETFEFEGIKYSIVAENHVRGYFMEVVE